MAQPNIVAIDGRTDHPLAVMINNKLKNLTPQVANTERPINIFRIPSYIREDNKNFYEPRMVSIGPYHRGRKHLKCMEEQKLVYLHRLLSYTDVPLSKFLEVLREHEVVARRCYYETIDMDSDQFVEMLLLDASFIIVLGMNTTIQDEADDILSEIGWYVPHIKSDILMLENQIPFFVLQRVFDLFFSTNDTCDSSILSNCDDSTSQESEPPKDSLFRLLVAFLQHENETLSLPNADQTFEHLLSFYYHCYMSMQKNPGNCQMKKMKTALPFISSIKRMTMRRRNQAISKDKRKPRMIPCATELKEAGITFKKTKSESIFNVDFSDGVLRIPFTSIEETTRTELMNLIAFEQCCGQKERPLSSYAVFMDCIVNTPRDVLILQQHGIIENKLADEKAAAVFFNQLRYCSYVDYENHHLARLFKDVKKYCDSRWHKYMARLNRDYFSNPWSTMSFLAAIVLLVLSTLQTVFTVLQYVNS